MGYTRLPKEDKGLQRHKTNKRVDESKSRRWLENVQQTFTFRVCQEENSQER